MSNYDIGKQELKENYEGSLIYCDAGSKIFVINEPTTVVVSASGLKKENAITVNFSATGHPIHTKLVGNEQALVDIKGAKLPLEIYISADSHLPDNAIINIRSDNKKNTATNELEEINNEYKLAMNYPDFFDKPIIGQDLNLDINRNFVLLNDTMGSNYFHGMDGNDNINGGLSNDKIFGDAGNDFIIGNYGNDRMNGGPGNDRLDGAVGTDTAVLDAGFRDLTVTSLGSLVVFEGATGRDEVKNTEVFEFVDLTIIQGDGNATVDDLFYLSRNTDVLVVGLDAEAHFSQYGWKEGRDPNAYFDTKGYLTAYGDVASAGIDPLQHYLTYGWKEGRDPSANFDSKAYLAANGDVAAAGVNPLEHFLQYGAAEGRAVQPGDGAFAVGMGPGVYI